MPSLPAPLRRPLGRLRLELQEGRANARLVPLTQQLRVWSHGFYGRHALLYDFDEHGFDAYVSDFQRATRLGGLNDGRHLLDDKVVSFLYLQAVGVPSPVVHAFADDGHLTFLEGAAEPRTLDGLLAGRGRLVIKPRSGSGGVRVYLVERRDDRTTVNGEPADDLRGCLRGAVVVSDFAEQHPYAAAVYPHATNTLRVLSLRDPDTGEPFVASAIHRFGTERSRPVDNTGSGGLPAQIDVATGVLGPLAAMPGYYVPSGSPVVWHERHPDTGTQVAGLHVPHWNLVVAELGRLMETLAGARMVGWDVVVTSDGFSVIEGNNRPDVNQLQVHEPLLSDPRTRRFFEHHDVVRRPARLRRRSGVRDASLRDRPGEHEAPQVRGPASHAPEPRLERRVSGRSA